MAAATVLLITSKAPGVDSKAIAAAAAAASSSPPGKEEEERVPEVVEDGPKS